MQTQHQLTHSDPVTQEITRVTEYINSGTPPIRRHGALPTINEGLPDGYSYVTITPRSEVTYNPDTHKLVRMTQPTTTEDGWDIVALTQEEIDARNTISVRKVDRVSFELALREILKIHLSDVAGFIESMPENNEQGQPDEALILAKDKARIRFSNSQNMKETDPLLIGIATNMVEHGLIPHDTGAEDIPAAKQEAVIQTVDTIFTRAQEISIELQ